MDSRLYWIWLQAAVPLGHRAAGRILEDGGRPEAIHAAGENELAAMGLAGLPGLLDKQLDGAADTLRRACAGKDWVLTPDDAAYPQRLREIAGPPLALFCRGDALDWQERPAFGLVGTRRATDGGKRNAACLAAGLAAGGMIVVSGGAVGIDGAAHFGAVRAGGVTIAEDWGSDEADRDGEVTLNIAEEHFFPWSPDSPFLYDLTVGTTQGEEEGFDTVHSYFALRKWECKEDAKGIRRFFLNDRPILLNGLLDQGYWPDGLYTPPSDAAVEHELHTVRELGFNLLRKHAKIEPERWYYHCDKLGIIVWQDMVNGGGVYPMWYVTYLTNALQPLMRRAPDGKLLWGFLGRGSAHSREEYARELADTVAALGRHPCIGCWVPFNEGWGQFDARKATETLRALDPSRPVDEASGWFDRGGGDVHSIHNYFYPLRIRPNVRTVALSEYGGIAWPMPGHEPPRKTYGYGTARSRAELTERYCDLQRKTVLPQLKKGLSALVYTQLTDVEDEVNGLFTYDRTAIKPDAAAVRAVNEALEAEFEKAVKA